METERQVLDLVSKIGSLASEFRGDAQMAQALKAALADGMVTEDELSLLFSLAAKLRARPVPDDGSGLTEGWAEVERMRMEWAGSLSMEMAAKEIMSDGKVTRQELESARTLAQRLTAERDANKPRTKPRWSPPVPRPDWAVAKRGEDEDD